MRNITLKQATLCACAGLVLLILLDLYRLVTLASSWNLIFVEVIGKILMLVYFLVLLDKQNGN
jgi:hypothetical protein